MRKTHKRAPPNGEVSKAMIEAARKWQESVAKYVGRRLKEDWVANSVRHFKVRVGGNLRPRRLMKVNFGIGNQAIDAIILSRGFSAQTILQDSKRRREAACRRLNQVIAVENLNK